ncbi:MAG: GDSL-type esterase/lipase family protein [Acidobacteria bacterium]|nr:GDSL-type esterase/lipase family protein [Acidobacteriota bacterium]
MRGCRVAGLALLVITGASAAHGQAAESEFIAFGDSITKGESRYDEQNRGGYPGRLQGKLRQANPDAIVHNAGNSGETTAQGVSRITFTLGNFPSADALLLMEGTNDINLLVGGLISFESIATNLATIANRAGNAGLVVYHATIIPRPPFARHDSRNTLTSALVRALRDVAFRQGRSLVDPYDKLFFTPGAFDTLYSRGDTVGHPNAAGFAVLADAFFDVVSGIDTQGPVPGELEPGYGVARIGPAIDLELTIYDLGDGIDPDNTTLTINGQAVETTLTGNARRQTLTHDTTKESLSCYARVGIRASDLADPPNVSDHVYKEYGVNGGTIIRGDINKSCRVDGVDLLIVALALGSRNGEARYSKAADLNNDGKVDGLDVAQLASKFGRSS